MSKPSSSLEDRLLDSYRYLCNTDNVNKQLTKQDVDEVKKLLKQIKTPKHVNSDPTAIRTVKPVKVAPMPKFSDRFKQRMATAVPDLPQHLPPPTLPSLPELPEDETPEDETAETSEQDDNDDVQSQAASVQSSQASSGARPGPKRKRKPETYEQTRMKQNLLVILNRLRQEGYQPTQDFTMDDSVHDIKNEIDQYYTCVESTSFVNKWKSNVESGAMFAEVGAQFIPKMPLQLNGLQKKIQQIHGSKQVDVDWERIYYTYRRKKAANPFMALVWAYGLAIGTTHFSNWATKKLNAKMKDLAIDGGNGGNSGTGAANQGDQGNPLGGIDLGGILQGLFGMMGNSQQESKQPPNYDMPSMTSRLPGIHRPAPPPPQTSEPSPSSTPHPAPARKFTRNVMFR